MDDQSLDETASQSREREQPSAAWPMLALLVLAGATLLAIQWRRPKAEEPFLGRPLPPLEVGGWLNTEKPLSADDLRGKVVLLDFWSTDCGYCLQHMPQLADLHDRFKDLGLQVVGLTPEPPAIVDRVKRVVDMMQINWPIGYGAGFMFQLLEVPGTPTYMLFDRTGRSVWNSHSLHGAEDAIVAALAKKPSQESSVESRESE